MCHNGNTAGFIIAKTAFLVLSVFVLIFTEIKDCVLNDIFSLVMFEYFHIEIHIHLL